ncbi:hypothetical protein [Marispirochaeta sp.]|jgi:hypothetical protein|uniref:hypothetical protein n=1 Tax=Marispirochaeta sp. TaxID=2038653 RepID=UPI0029C88D22|nr:hypothetical protein [Marispirochaeta sp.]
MPRGADWIHGLPKGVRIYILAVAGIALVSVVGLLIFYSPHKQLEKKVLTSNDGGTVYTRLLLPQEKTGLIANEHVPLRSRREQWTGEQVKRYWIPPQSIVLELLKEENHALLEEIFDSVP